MSALSEECASGAFSCFLHCMPTKLDGVCAIDVGPTVSTGRAGASRADVWTVAPAELFDCNIDDCAGYEPMERFLSREEKEKAARFLRPCDRRTFSAAHSALRIILARRLGCRPLELSFGMGNCGKPFLRDECSVHFNISHSGDEALIAVSDYAEVGVDVEKQDRFSPREFYGMAESFFSEAETNWIAKGDACERFLRCWCAREAVLKAVGLGLSIPLEMFSIVPPENDAQFGISGIPAEAVGLDPLPGYVGAFAVSVRNECCRPHRFDEEGMPSIADGNIRAMLPKKFSTSECVWYRNRFRFFKIIEESGRCLSHCPEGEANG